MNKPYRELKYFAVKGKDVPVEAFVYDRQQVFEADHMIITSDDLVVIMQILLAGGDPTKGLTSKGKRFGYDSQEARIIDMLDLIRSYMRAYGECYLTPSPVFFDKERSRLCPITPTDAYSVLAPLGFTAGLPQFKAVSENLYKEAVSPSSRQWVRRDINRVSYIKPDFSAAYISSSPTSLIKITPDNVEEVPLGTDDVLIASDAMDTLPSFDAISEELTDVSETIGKAITRPAEGSRLTDYLTARFDDSGILRPEQAQWMLMTRFLFVFASNLHPMLWPLLIVTGETGSGKSTVFEIIMTILTGRMEKLDAMPFKMRDLISYLTNRGICMLDNVDYAFDEGGHDVQNLVCQASTGANISIAQLYETNKDSRHQVQTHLFLTSRDEPFSREDLQRRTIHLRTRRGAGEEVKTRLLEKALRSRVDMWAEIFIRVQNMLKAHKQNAKKTYKYQSRMKEYEHFTLLCADYEGCLPAAEELWSSYMATFEAAITRDNPVLTSVMLWIGEDESRAGSSIFVEPLFQQISGIYKRLGMEFGYKTAASWGKAMTNNLVALRQGAGMSEERDKKTWRRQLVFAPNEIQKVAAAAMYQSMAGEKRNARGTFPEFLAERRKQVSSEIVSETQTEAVDSENNLNIEENPHDSQQ